MVKSVLIAGPTAAGKSAVAFELAKRINGEIISVDSMQVYRGLDKGTAKPSTEERAQVPHHLIDVADLSANYDAARFCEDARLAETRVRARGRVPIFCGGTGLYFNAYVAGLGESPPGDPALRAELEAKPLRVLLEELRAKDPDHYEKIDKSNPRRIVRAVEVIRLTGQPYSKQRARWHRAGDDVLKNCLAIGVTRPTGLLHAAIHARVEQMFKNGLVDETKALLERGLEQNRTAMQAIGYRQVVEHLQGERSLSATVELVKQRTRQLAKRQLTWFNHQMRLDWKTIESEPQAFKVAELLAEMTGTKG